MAAPVTSTPSPHAVPGAGGLSGYASGYRKAEPYLAACYSLVGSVVGCTFLGYGLDRWRGHPVPWLLLIGAVVGMVVGFVSFFFQIARAGRGGGSALQGPSRALRRGGASRRVERPGT